MAKNPEEYVLPSTEQEALRLEVQGAQLYGGTDFLLPYLADSPRRVLEVGCGTGIFTRFVASRLVDCQVVGLDPDEQRVSFASSQPSPANLTYRQGGLLRLPFSDGEFDLVYSRFVLVHIGDPRAGLQEMARVCRPGGRIVAHEMVHDGIWHAPEKPSFSAVLHRIMEIMRQRGMEPSQGLYLPSDMLGIGLMRVDACPITHSCLGAEPIFQVYRENWLAILDGMGSVLGDQLDADLLGRAQAELEEQRDDTFLLAVTVVASGFRP